MEDERALDDDHVEGGVREGLFGIELRKRGRSTMKLSHSF